VRFAEMRKRRARLSTGGAFPVHLQRSA
jgi:hypothetical protein